MHVVENTATLTSFLCSVLQGHIVNDSYQNFNQGRSRLYRKLKLSKGMHGPGVGSWGIHMKF